MISTKKLIRMARKWRKIAAIGRKRITPPRTNPKMAAVDRANKSSVADKGHFVVYTMDKKRFVIPLAYLSNSIFQELFKMSEEEFGLSSDGPITLPCDSVFMSYIVLLVQRGLAKDLENAVLNSIAGYGCSSSYSTFFHGELADQ
ncbi:auxin-responsive protein SAUR68-like [Durio zibethinus]|uniref:Auxin-responsive protein SAUR68-like n=1 Tax=Durio zibethinus TaxID=66656 RepID=A0A6P5Z9Y4_DURZI|nr:auxin-responsive protein SAUR68-like [Durio zibethinus]